MQPLKEQDLPSPSSSSDFKPENYTHLAWIPCVSGHLDYCLMSTGLCGNFIENKFDKNPVNINYCDGKYSEGHQRKVILKSWVDWRDQLEGDGEFNVVVIAETNNTNDLDARSLSGRICIFPKEYETLISEEFQKFYLPISSANKIWLRHKKRDKSSQDHLTNYEKIVSELNNQYNALQFSFQSPAFGNTATEVYYIDFYLLSNGFVYLKYVDTELDQIRSIDDNDKYVLVRQAFYYLKYSLHKHKHHGEEADALTTIIPYASDDLDRITGLQIIGQLKRELTRIKRTLSGKSRSYDDGQALGILGYMRSLLQSSLQSKLIGMNVYEREVAWLEGMTQSIRTQGEGAALKKNKYNQSNQNAIQLMIFGLAFISFAVIGWLTLEATGGVAKTYGDTWAGGSSLTRLLFDAQNYLMFIGGVFLLLVCVHRALHTVATLEVRPRFTRRVKRMSWLRFATVAISITLLLGGAFFASIWPWPWP